MAQAVKQLKQHDSRVPTYGDNKRVQQKFAAMKKVESKLATSISLSTSGAALVSGLVTPSNKPKAAKVVTPKKPVTQPQSQVKVVPKVESMPKPVKVKAKKAVTQKKPCAKKSEVVERSDARPDIPQTMRLLRTEPPSKYTSRTYIQQHEALVSFSDDEHRANLLALEMVHRRYLDHQDVRTLTATVHAMPVSDYKGKKTQAYVERTNALHNTLERLATFESVCHLTDDNGEYVSAELIVKDYVTIAGVRFTLGNKREWVMVPRSDSNVKASNRSMLDRAESIKSRTPARTQSIVKAVTEAVAFDEELPSWPAFAIPAVQAVVRDAIARGYGSLEAEFDNDYGSTRRAIQPAFEKDFSLKHIPRGINVSEMLEAEQVKRNMYMNGLADLPTGTPHYMADHIVADIPHWVDDGVEAVNDDGPSPTTPAPAAAMPDWTALTGDALDAELALCFAALEDRDAKEQVDGHFHPATLRRLQGKYQMTYEQWTRWFTDRKNRGVLIRQHYDKLNRQAMERNQALREETRVRTKRHHFRKTKLYQRLKTKKYYRDLFSLEMNRWRDEALNMSHMQAALQHMEQTYPSDPRADDERYHQWLRDNNEDTQEDLVYHLKHMETQKKYDDMFSVVNHRASYRKHKPMQRPVPESRRLAGPPQNDQDPPPTGAAPVCDGPVIVGQSFPDFLTAGDGTTVAFRAGVSTIAGVIPPSKALVVIPSMPSWFEWELPMLATG